MYTVYTHDGFCFLIDINATQVPTDRIVFGRIAFAQSFHSHFMLLLDLVSSVECYVFVNTEEFLKCLF